MSTDWPRINDLFHRALAEPPDRREAFLAAECADDPALLAEVTSLLLAHDRAGEFIETPVARAGEPIGPVESTGHSAVGTTILHYVIRRVLGEGGMGVVYLAEDTRLGRLVALKSLAPRFTGDPGRRERLRREARAAAALTHSGIATVYALEESGEHLYIASEFVPGETLRDELARGPLPVATVIQTGVSLAHALATAHDRGLIHRDIKPENIIRLPDGSVKILDFGLARFRDDEAPLARLTEAGSILGTPAYMSPEQIRGDAVDARADQFALGLVLYELTAGVHPLAGSDPASTLARILENRPAPLAEGRPPAPGLTELSAAVMRCLEKEPQARFGSTHALVGALERARHAVADAAMPPHVSPTPRPPAPPPDLTWWWTFHQAAAVVSYAALLVPLWWTREWTLGLSSMLVFLAGLVGAIAADVLRLHLWFTLRSSPSEWAGQQARTRPWIQGADLLFVAALVTGAVGILITHAGVATTLVAAAVAVLLASTIIEPSTTRAAFTPRDSSPTSEPGSREAR